MLQSKQLELLSEFPQFKNKVEDLEQKLFSRFNPLSFENIVFEKGDLALRAGLFYLITKAISKGEYGSTSELIKDDRMYFSVGIGHFGVSKEESLDLLYRMIEMYPDEIDFLANPDVIGYITKSSGLVCDTSMGALLATSIALSTAGFFYKKGHRGRETADDLGLIGYYVNKVTSIEIPKIDRDDAENYRRCEAIMNLGVYCSSVGAALHSVDIKGWWSNSLMAVGGCFFIGGYGGINNYYGKMNQQVDILKSYISAGIKKLSIATSVKQKSI